MFPERKCVIPDRTPIHGRGIKTEQPEEKKVTPIEKKMHEVRSETAISLSALSIVVSIAIAASVMYVPDLSMREVSQLAMIELLFLACMAAAYRGNCMEYELFLYKTSPEVKSKQ
jgi:predicted membrane protein